MGPKKKKLTHFISIPLATKQNILSYDKFRRSVLNQLKKGKDGFSSETTGIDETVFRDELTLHITLLMLSLKDKESIDKAVSLLQKALGDFKSFDISCSTLSCFPSLEHAHKSNVLFVEPDEQSREYLKQISIKIFETFLETEFVSQEDLRFHYTTDGQVDTKYHVTLLNSKYKKFSSPSTKSTRSFTLDVRPVLEKFRSSLSLRGSVDEIHLSSLYDDKASNGFYSSEAQIHAHS